MEVNPLSPGLLDLKAKWKERNVPKQQPRQTPQQKVSLVHALKWDRFFDQGRGVSQNMHWSTV
jgi:hypothetical protein